MKRILGTVPIEADGSVAFEAPPSTALHFQLLDENYRALQTMRSFAGVMPGERRGCMGCHESHSRAPQYQSDVLALAAQPRTITPPPWGDESVSYPRFVRPVLDQYCAKCHEGDGEARKVLDLTERPGFLSFDETYMLFTGNPSWGAPYQKPANPPPGFGIANMIMVEGYDQRRSGGLSHAGADDLPVLQQPPDRHRRVRQTLRRAGGSRVPAAAHRLGGRDVPVSGRRGSA